MYRFRKNTAEDVSNYELNNFINPHIDRFKKYIQEYVLPSVCAFYIYSGYQMEALYTDSFDMFIKDVLAMTNEEYKLTKALKENTKKILKLNYGLTIKTEDPLSFL